MPAGALRELLRKEIESFPSENALKVAKVAEDSERAFLEQIAARGRRRGR
jgi:hypothetical protein